MVSLSPLSRLDEAAFAQSSKTAGHSSSVTVEYTPPQPFSTLMSMVGACPLKKSSTVATSFRHSPVEVKAARKARSRLSLLLTEAEKAFSKSSSCGMELLKVMIHWRSCSQGELRCPPKTWWSAFFTRTRLANVALRVLNIVVSSAAVERANSVQLRIHSKERNRLLHHRVEKLMKISVNRRIQSGQKRQRHVELVLPPLDEVDEDYMDEDTL